MKQAIQQSVLSAIILLITNLFINIDSLGQSCSSNDIGFNSNIATNSLNICIGTTGTTIDGGNPPSNETYTWQVSSTLVTGPFSNVSPDPGDAQNWTISSVYYNSVGTYYFRRVISGNAGCNGNSDVVTLAVIALPAAVTISGGGTICGNSNTTLTASNGGSGTIYFQGTTQGGTSTANPSTSQVVNSSGTYYFRAMSGPGCWGTEGSKTVIFITPPSTTGVNICQGGSGTLTSSTSCLSFVNSGTTISGTWNAASDPIANKLSTSITNSATCSFASPAVLRNYVAQKFQVNISGTYTIEMSQHAGYDGMGYIVSDAFVPGNCPGSGTFVRGDNDSGPNNEPSMTTNLVAGITYTLISTTYSTTSGTYSGPFTWTVTPPSGGQIMLPVASSIQWFTTASGGTSIGSGSPFNPVGVSGSGLPNTNTTGTTVFYAECASNPGCRTATNFVINPNATINLTSAPATSAQTICLNGTVNNITYAIGGGATGAAVTGLPSGVTGSYNTGVFTISGTSTAVPGTYNYTVTTTSTCTQTSPIGSIIVSAPTTASFTKTMASVCGGGADGSITVTPAGGTAPYSYSWSSTPSSYSASTATITGLTTKDYTVVVSDASGCSVTIPDITIWQAFAAVVTNNGGSSGTCANTGSIILYGSGGVQPFTYSIDGVNYFASNSFTGLPAGTYTGYVKDFGGCISTKPNIIVTSAQPLVVTSFARSATSCANNGSIELYRTGGIPPYTYSINDITYQSGNMFSGLAGGTYTGWVKDSKGCKSSLPGISVLKASAVTVSASKTNTSACSNSGYIELHPGGGVPGYTYSLNNITYQASNAFSGLAAGSYNGWVQDSKGCKNVLFGITIGTDAASVITVTSNATVSNGCSNSGSIQLFRTGGVAPFTYSIDNITFQSSNTFTALAAGTYTGWVKDAKGCKASKVGIIITQASAVTSTGSHTNSSTCTNDGTIQLRPSGGTLPYTFSLDDIFYQSGNAFSGLASGNYSCWVKDVNGCKASVNITIGLNPIAVTAYASPAGNCSAADGSVQIFRTGGTGPYSYSLDGNNYQSSNVFSNLVSGDYTCYVKDSKTCIGSLFNVSVGPDCPPAFAKNNMVTTISAKNIENNESKNNQLNIVAYPNPTTSEFNLQLKGSIKEKVEIIVTDNLGRKVYRSGSIFTNQISFGKHFKPGIYTVEVMLGNQKQSIKVIKE